MNWLIFAILALITYGIFDFFVKQTGGKIHDGLGNLIISIIPVIAMILFIIYSVMRGENLFIKPGGVKNSILAGVAISFASLFFLKTFSAGANLSIGIPLVRIGMIAVSVVLGILILKEPIHAKQLAGFVVALVGLYLLMSK